MKSIGQTMLFFVFAIFSFWGCGNQKDKYQKIFNSDEAISEINKQADKDSSFSFILDDCLRDSIVSFITETPMSLYNRPVKTTISVDCSDDENVVSIFRMISFVYPLDENAEKELLGASKCKDESIVIYSRKNIPSFINLSLLDYERGVAILEEDINIIHNEGLESSGYIKTFKKNDNNGWDLIERRNIWAPVIH